MTTWIILRAAGIGAFVMLFLSVAWGLVATTSILGKRVSKASATLVHQFMASAGLLLLAGHLALVLGDRWVKFTWVDLLVPLHSSFRPVAIGFGVLAMYGTVLVLASSWARKQIGTVWWRKLHVWAVPAFTLSMLHGIFSGTDTVRPWMYWTYVSTGGLVLFLLIVRAFTIGLRPERAARPERATRPEPAIREERVPALAD